MAAFTVMTPPPSGDALRDAERVAFVKDGFSWPALFIPIVWALYHKLWLVLVFFVIAAVAVVVAAISIDPNAGIVAAIAFALLFAFEANFLRRWTLSRHGWQMAAIVVGRDRIDNERRFFERWLNRDDEPAGHAEPKAGMRMAPIDDDDAVIGLFPRREGT